MGQAGSKGAAGAAPMDQKQISEKYNLTESQVQTLVGAFQKEAPKGKIDKSHFVKIIAAVRKTHPELAVFDDEIVGLVFTFCDTDHSGKLDPFEVVAALSIFAKGEQQDKARLVFKTIDKDHSGVLTKDEIRSHARKVCSFSANLMKSDVKGAVKGMLGSVAASAMGTALNALELQFVEDIIRDIMTTDENKDGYISEEEWLNAAKTNNTVKALIDPNLSANAWRVIFGLEAGGSPELKVQLLQLSPKGFATIFDWEIEQGTVAALGKYEPPPPPPDIRITLTSTKAGASTTQPVTVTPKMTYAELLELACSTTDLPRDNIGLLGPKAVIGDSRFPDLAVYEHVTEGDTIQVLNAKSWTGEIKITTLTGKTFPIACSATTKVSEVKQKIQDLEGIPPDQQRLISSGRQMDDEKTLADYTVLQGGKLHLVLRLRGM